MPSVIPAYKKQLDAILRSYAFELEVTLVNTQFQGDGCSCGPFTTYYLQTLLSKARKQFNNQLDPVGWRP